LTDEANSNIYYKILIKKTEYIWSVNGNNYLQRKVGWLFSANNGY